jgi:predicted DNA-binding transcriptional regulator AlpA
LRTARISIVSGSALRLIVDGGDNVRALSSDEDAQLMTLHPDSLAYPPRGMSRDEAARYIGVGVTKFDEMVADRRMPRPKRVDGRVIWDRFKLEAAFTDLPENNRTNPLDCILSDHR